MEKRFTHDCKGCKYLFTTEITEYDRTYIADIYLCCNWAKDVHDVLDGKYSLQYIRHATKFIIRYGDEGHEYRTCNMFDLGRLLGEGRIDVIPTGIEAIESGNAQHCRRRNILFRPKELREELKNRMRINGSARLEQEGVVTRIFPNINYPEYSIVIYKDGADPTVRYEQDVVGIQDLIEEMSSWKPFINKVSDKVLTLTFIAEVLLDFPVPTIISAIKSCAEKTKQGN